MLVSAAGRRLSGWGREDDAVTVGVENGEFAAAIPIDLRSPFDGSVGLDSLVFCQGIGDMNPYRHLSRWVVRAGGHQLESDRVSLEDCEACGFGWLAVGAFEAQDVPVELTRGDKPRDRESWLDLNGAREIHGIPLPGSLAGCGEHSRANSAHISSKAIPVGNSWHCDWRDTKTGERPKTIFIMSPVSQYAGVFTLTAQPQSKA